jgi:hypothetical protein
MLREVLGTVYPIRLTITWKLNKMAVTKISKEEILRRVQNSNMELKTLKKSILDQKSQELTHVQRQVKYNSTKMNLEDTPINRSLGLTWQEDEKQSEY